MSLATRCPHCNTIFKVVQDQLKVSEGWVRCGRCSEVFNALEGLFDMEREAPPQRIVPPAPPTAPQPESTMAPAGRVQDAPPAFQATEPSAFDPGPDWDRPGATVPVPPPSSAPPPDDGLPPQDARPTPAVTHFELDLPPSDEAVAAAMSALTQPAIRTTHADEQDEGDDASYPVTDEADALDSRYLLPSDEMRRPAQRRRPRRGGPEFADAQFPSDAMADLDDDWDTGWNRPIDAADDSSESARLAHAVLAEPPEQAGTATAPHMAPAPPQPGPTSPSTGVGVHTAAFAPPQADAIDPDTGPSTMPSRLPGDEGYQPEQSLPPPSKRRGRPGTRGRVPQTEAPGFIKQAERKAIWRHPLVRGVLSLIALVLAALLAAQFVQQEHDRLASRHPGLTPYLSQWCRLTGCRLNPPMQIDDLQVDNIALVKTSSQGEDTYRLTAIIHNRAEAMLAWPHLDLSLTDANGAVVVRRVFDVHTASRVPTEAADAPATTGVGTQVPDAVPASSSTTLQWQLRAPDLALAGYTVELFYP